MSDVSRAERVRAVTESLRDGALVGLLEQAVVLDEAVMAVLDSRLAEGHRDKAQRAAHNISGTAGIFGFHRATALGRELEAYFADGAALTAAAHAAGLVEELHASLLPTWEASSAPQPPSADTIHDSAGLTASQPVTGPVVLLATSARAATGVSTQLGYRELAVELVEPELLDEAFELSELPAEGWSWSTCRQRAFALARNCWRSGGATFRRWF